MKKKIAALFLLAFMYFSVCFGYDNVTNYAPKYGILKSNSNLRTGPSTTYKSLRVLPAGTNVKLVGEIDNFYIIQTAGNQVGMISKDLIESTDKAPEGAAVYTSLAPKIAKITDSVVNVRSGPGTGFDISAKVYKDNTVKIIGEIDNFYMVVTQNNNIGMIRKDLINIGGESNNGGTNTGELTDDEKYVLDLINEERRNAGLVELAVDNKLQNIAKLKAEDMVKNNYFSHTSPTYGSPFDMMKDFGITYRAAGENIAGNPNLKNAVTSWMNSESHRENILSNNYNYIGIGVVPSERYGYIVVAMFIGK